MPVLGRGVAIYNVIVDRGCGDSCQCWDGVWRSITLLGGVRGGLVPELSGDLHAFGGGLFLCWERGVMTYPSWEGVWRPVCHGRGLVIYPFWGVGWEW